MESLWPNGLSKEPSTELRELRFRLREHLKRLVPGLAGDPWLFLGLPAQVGDTRCGRAYCLRVQLRRTERGAFQGEHGPSIEVAEPSARGRTPPAPHGCGQRSAACVPMRVCRLLDLTDGNQRVLLHRGRSKVRATLECYAAEQP